MRLPTTFAFSLLGLGLVVATGSAQPAGTVGDPTLRVGVRCADALATPDGGLRVTVDGAPLSGGVVEGVNQWYWGKHGPYTRWEATDVGFAVASGVHRIAVEAPGCAAEARDLDVGPQAPRSLVGRLSIVDESLAGPVGAPNGIGLALAYVQTGLPASTGSSGFAGYAGSYRIDHTDSRGAAMTLSYERRALAVAWDYGLGGGTRTGTIQAGLGGASGPEMPFSEATMQMRSSLRIGARVRWNEIALAAGGGLGGEMWMATAPSGNVPTAVVLTLPHGVDANWFVPVWASLTLKPSCSWGVQALASYDARPTDLSSSGVSLGAGVMWQPSDACAQRPYVVVR
jgi:hypothetical protein